MASYYYLTAQLPSIFPNIQPPMSFKAFKELALRSLSKKDAQILETLSLEPPREEESTGSAYLDKWYEFERSLRLALEQVRSAKLKWEVPVSYDERILLSSAFTPVQIARAAAAIQNPLEAETFLDNARFQAADTVRGSEVFSSDGVFSYAVKLLLRERASKFETEKGREEYSSIYNSILDEEK
ncbi:MULTISPECIES: DUF2764 domain-containing protein [unclassified Treponema]|uniref:DUF2764 domain-containing protein n=1 Tax=unclassified Treponema TaxID=2638727 RepID=UPI0020A27F8F|nr:MULTISPECIES: DUF2764 domain-containing protein [unclassified Treponema]UTC68265.1 hypothetical protein E4O06_06425 [Treponema sp. OMZ 789]UTC70985.1 hypothetical protein E4O01_06570 [Treponema sp. OMZ 790]UTC73725.1 hypothetical protein E4O02_06765 [Treponema sp. OMZ 791]